MSLQHMTNDETVQRIATAKEEAMNIADRKDMLEKSLQRMLDWIRAIDTKTQIALGLNLAMLGGLVAVIPKPEDLIGIHYLLIFVGGLSPIWSCGLCIRAFFPQTKGPGDSRLFFCAVDNRTLDGFSTAVSNETVSSYSEDLTEQVYRNAQIATSKYKYVTSAILWQTLGVLPWLFVCYWFYKGA